MSVPTMTPSQAPTVAYVPLQRLRAHPDNVRRDLGDLRELVDSIARQGVLQPLRAERRPGAEVLRIRAGHRRAAAAELAGLRKVPCVIVAEAEADEAIAEMFAENLHRAGLTAAEKRDNARRLIDDFGYTVDGVATATGCHPTTVYGWLRTSPAQTRQAIHAGERRQPGSGQARAPRVRSTELHAVVSRWRELATGGLDPTQACALLDDVEALLQGWTPPASTAAGELRRAVS